ncbi:nucleoside phosphorylase domain-containing protein [Aspergillus karnatakaensis]|uniref:5'-methylthioadenosine/S-adenosylhomocysteine nucleosidase family protein n=1 Tax=Aspergillus karnatakaensis TaxID=1810916 RepID=UPI003CCD1245
MMSAEQEKSPISRPTSREHFTVAVFCALPKEANAVSYLFTETWAQPMYGKADKDENTYTLGRIGDHNVVLVHMAGMGKRSACQAASCARSSYPGIKLALVVGIFGGLPRGDGHNELILGDVIISDDIVQYDLGRQYPGTFETRSGHEVRRQPPREFQSILSKLKSTRGRTAFAAKISQYVRVQCSGLAPEPVKYPGYDQDELFQPEYRHEHREPSACNSCDGDEGETVRICAKAQTLPCDSLKCDKKFLVKRKRLEFALKHEAPLPEVHIGPVGSGDTVMKSGLHRDRIADQHGLLAFEMEASGVCNVFPALVIKGVCDYADSHKNKSWQEYSALTAAAGMKAFLEEWAG